MVYLLLKVLLGLLVFKCVFAFQDKNSSNGYNNIPNRKDLQHYDGPIIIPSRSEIILNKGENFTLHCKAKTKIQMRQQDIPEEVTGNFIQNLTILQTNDKEYSHEVALSLFNVDEFAVGYYACFDDTIDSNKMLKNIFKEPSNTEHISFIYIYVNGLRNYLAPMSEHVKLTNDSEAFVQCRPTAPDINIQISLDFEEIEYDSYFNPKLGFKLVMDEDILHFPIMATCIAGGSSSEQFKEFIIYEYSDGGVKPNVTCNDDRFIEGETFTLICSADSSKNAVSLTWHGPNNKKHYKENITDDTGRTSMSITIVNASKSDEGIYKCDALSGNVNSASCKKTIVEPSIRLDCENNRQHIGTKSMFVNIKWFGYPKPSFKFFKNNEEFDTKNGNLKKKSLLFNVYASNVNSAANYTVVAYNQYNQTENITFEFLPPFKPEIIHFSVSDADRYVKGQQINLQCIATGVPAPDITWLIDGETVTGNFSTSSKINTSSTLSLQADTSKYIKCVATNNMFHVNSIYNDTKESMFHVYEIKDGFGIVGANESFVLKGSNIDFKCLASKYDFEYVTWDVDFGPGNVQVISVGNETLSHISILRFNDIQASQSGNFTCTAKRMSDNSMLTKNIILSVDERRPARIINNTKISDLEVQPFQNVELFCIADGIPMVEEISWFQNDKRIKNKIIDKHSSINITFRNISRNTIESKLSMLSIEENYGKIECRAANEDGEDTQVFEIIKIGDSFNSKLLYFIGVLLLGIILLVIYLVWKVRKEKRFRRELAAAGLLYFKEGNTKYLNPDLGLNEQADLLPYDDKFEFPPEKLELVKQLGAGAFGVVYKAVARGIHNAEETTTVAVKTVKNTADNMFIKALATELKIMCHMGRHVNIVNLLGACTKNVGKRELSVILEYCKYGNIHNYIQKHREVFIDQLTDNEKKIGQVNRAYTSSTGGSGMHSEYFGSNQSQATDVTFVNTINTNKSDRKVSESGYVHPEWTANYDGDYVYDGRPLRPLRSHDLLTWGFQIAKGMEYLASRKVLHGDLACRNILLSDDNIVKICDFGLARSIYGNDEYQKKDNSPLPVKWLALECMTDRIFSTQSDVWSYGIVLWEMFSLAKTPYPNVSPHDLVVWLTAGNRLEKPTYADDRLYQIMKSCWRHKPNERPSFTDLQQSLGSFLEDNVRNYILALNMVNDDANKTVDKEDYLAMVSSPDYNNMVATPSPPHYVNEISFYPRSPSALQHDEEGYLQMSPATNKTEFSTRSQGTKFDYDDRKLYPRAYEPGPKSRSETTPMLTQNNFSARPNSESDNENIQIYELNTFPTIDEEIDEVFDNKYNNKKNVTQNDAVSNPTYISIETDKIPHGKNQYVNVNGLVK